MCPIKRELLISSPQPSLFPKRTNCISPKNPGSKDENNPYVSNDTGDGLNCHDVFNVVKQYLLGLCHERQRCRHSIPPLSQSQVGWNSGHDRTRWCTQVTNNISKRRTFTCLSFLLGKWVNAIWWTTWPPAMVTERKRFVQMLLIHTQKCSRTLLELK